MSTVIYSNESFQIVQDQRWLIVHTLCCDDSLPTKDNMTWTCHSCESVVRVPETFVNPVCYVTGRGDLEHVEAWLSEVLGKDEFETVDVEVS